MLTSALFFLQRLQQEYRRLLGSRGFLASFVIGVNAFFFACVVNYVAGRYATAHAGIPLHDSILGVIPRIDTSFIHAYAGDVIGLFTLALSIVFPHRAPFLLKSLALLVVVRAIFINMTNIGIYPDAVPLSGSLITFGGDLFFSGHVAIMVLFGFVFWNFEAIRYVFFGLAIILGESVLLGHFHYTIDVAAAPFIAYGIFRLSRRLFWSDYTRISTSYASGEIISR